MWLIGLFRWMRGWPGARSTLAVAASCGVVWSTQALLLGLLAFFAPALWQRHAGVVELLFVWYLTALAIGSSALTTRRVSVVALCIVGAYALFLRASAR